MCYILDILLAMVYIGKICVTINDVEEWTFDSRRCR